MEVTNGFANISSDSLVHTVLISPFEKAPHGDFGPFRSISDRFSALANGAIIWAPLAVM